MSIDRYTHGAYLLGMEHIKHIWPTVRELADDLGLPYTTVHSWSVRGRIPSERDFEIIAAAAKRGHTITFEFLAVARRSPQIPPPAAPTSPEKDVA